MNKLQFNTDFPLPSPRLFRKIISINMLNEPRNSISNLQSYKHSAYFTEKYIENSAALKTQRKFNENSFLLLYFCKRSIDLTERKERYLSHLCFFH